MYYPVGEHFVLGFDGVKINRKIKRFLSRCRPGGVIIFRRNIESPKQLKGLISGFQKASDSPLLVGVDQEGGLVMRLRHPFTELPPMSHVGRYYAKTKSQLTVKKIGQILGRELKAIGFNWNFSPVVDVHSNPKNPVIGNRSFGPNPKTVFECADALIRGMHQEGVLSCAKHFPGHGATSVDSHLDLPVVDDAGRLIWKRDVYPYRELLKKRRLLSVMTAHVSYPNLDNNYCATLSSSILYGLLRKRMKYNGLIVSDDLQMKGITNTHSIYDACKLFFDAGGDLAMICKDMDVQMETIEKMKMEVNRNPALEKRLIESGKRIKRIKKRFCMNKRKQPLRVVGCREHQEIVRKIGLFSSRERLHDPTAFSEGGKSPSNVILSQRRRISIG
jgi:beta-N-acetylhexosaminidase